MRAKYQEFSELNLPSLEKEIRKNWEQYKAFEQSVSLREGCKPFVFYEGPPSANGMPGIHHVISRTLKDMTCRYKTMRGFQVKRKGGWDTHGLPVELGVEKELKITKDDIGKKISIADYNKKCREAVLRYKDQWDELTKDMGYWVDLHDPYITFDNKYIETLWYLLKKLYEKGFLYQSVSIQPYSPAAGTGLSSHELNQPGTYKMVKDTTAVVMFRALRNQDSKFLFEDLSDEDVFFMAWTTTPWTLPSNLGLTVGEKIDYVLVKTINPYSKIPVNVILAETTLASYFKEEGKDKTEISKDGKILPWTILKKMKGKALVGLRYEQLMPFEANKPALSGGDPFKVIPGDFVTTEDGTGIVHTAPAFGADDYRVGQKHNLGILTLVDKKGRLAEGLGEFSGRYVKNYIDDPAYQDVNVDICVALKKCNRAFKIEKIEHSYPHCWRTDKPILYYPLDAWFIRTTAVKDQMVALNKTIKWKPQSTGEGRFGNWLENMVDWNLSRSRFWGTPLPIWRTLDLSEEKCIGSIEELREEAKKANEVLGSEVNINLDKNNLDLHRPLVDEITLVSSKGEPMKRVPDLVDVWFDSGSMPYAQLHYPFENKDQIEGGKAFPADFVCEGVDQTRGWFYTLHAIAVMLFGSVAYKSVMSNGLVLDKNGNKMSKRLGNAIDPFKIIDQYGADATRWYLITNASPWDNLKFDPDGIKEVQRKFFGTLYNTYQFFALYANVDGFEYKETNIALQERSEIDQWILSSLNTLIKDVVGYFDDYEPTLAGRAIEDFVEEHLSNWYVRLSRRRFWKGDYEKDKISAFQTLYTCLETVSRLMAPIAPFFSDAIFIRLNAVTGKSKLESIHHADFPASEEWVINKALEERMQMAQDICSLGLSLRKKENIKVRQPLQKVLIPVLNEEMKRQLEKVESLIKAEINVKEIAYITNTEAFISKKAKPNFKTLGKKMGAKMKSVAAAIALMKQREIASLENIGSFDLKLEDETIHLNREDVEILTEDIPGWSVTSKGNLTVALDLSITEELRMEGDAREFVNRIQNIRKDKGFELTDRIEVMVLEENQLSPSLKMFNDYICAEILTDKITWVTAFDEAYSEIEVNNNLLQVVVTKKG